MCTLSPKISFMAAIVAFWLINPLTSPSVDAQSPVIHNIDFTEQSSNTLTATYDGTLSPKMSELLFRQRIS